MPNTNELRDEMAALARRTAAANGFGEAAVSSTAQLGLLDSIELSHQARALRSANLRQLLGAAYLAITGWMRQTLAEWKRRRHAHATLAALRGLDARMLRDLGFHRSELMSVAAEIAGAADSTRTRLVLAGRVPSL